MCAITSLIINDYFGGDICKIHVDGISHYFNLIDDHLMHTTNVIRRNEWVTRFFMWIEKFLFYSIIISNLVFTIFNYVK